MNFRYVCFWIFWDDVDIYLFITLHLIVFFENPILLRFRKAFCMIQMISSVVDYSPNRGSIINICADPSIHHNPGDPQSTLCPVPTTHLNQQSTRCPDPTIRLNPTLVLLWCVRGTDSDQLNVFVLLKALKFGTLLSNYLGCLLYLRVMIPAMLD